MKKKISTEECKELMVETLANVDRFCNQYGIKYSLSYGTLIGAIRHKGFIPWDDDIDIIMPREDYDRFISLYKDDRYKIIDGAFNSNHSHIRVSDQKTVLELNAWRSQFYKEGLWIDVFPLDKVPDTQKGYVYFRRWLWFLFEMQLTGEVRRKGVVNMILYMICKPFQKICGKKALRTMKRFNDKNTHSVANMSAWYLNSPKFPASYFDEYIDVEFEGHRFKAIKQYDVFLRELYGDYMQLPPEEKRIAHHTYDAYWRD